MADAAQTARSAAFAQVIAEVVAVACVTLITADWLGPWWQALLAALAVSVAVALVVVRTRPRLVGRRHPLTMLLALSRLLTVVVRLTARVTRLPDTPRQVYERELADMVERVSESDLVADDERELIRSVFELGDTLTREVMVPRTDMITVGRDEPLASVLALFVQSGFSRMPVIYTSPDDVVGIAYFKDVVRALQSAPGDAARPVERVARRALFVPESKPVDDLLRGMQADASHIAMVVDEYGGIAGLVTIEDALEEIVGELTDEHDAREPEPQNLGDGVFRVPARLELDELGELFGVDIDDDDVDTAAGLLAKALGKVPLPGAKATVHGVHLVAERVGGRRKQLASLLASATRIPELRDGE